MELEKTACIFIGFQNDYFAKDGILTGAIEESARNTGILVNTVTLLEQLVSTPMTLIQTPIIFTEDYSELSNPVGILKLIKDVGAFQAGTSGADVIAEIKAFEDHILSVPGKRCLNAFSNTNLAMILQEADINHVVLAGAVTSICIDSTARSSLDQGYQVTILSDCTAARTNVEQDFFCTYIFPLYASVMTSREFLLSLALPVE